MLCSSKYVYIYDHQPNHPINGGQKDFSTLDKKKSEKQCFPLLDCVKCLVHGLSLGYFAHIVYENIGN